MRYAAYVMGGALIGCLFAWLVELLLMTLTGGIGSWSTGVAFIVGLILGLLCGIPGALVGIALYDRRNPIL